MFELVGFGRACAHPSFLGELPRQTGRCAPPPAHRSFAASCSTPKNIYNLSNLRRSRQWLFSFHWTPEAMKYDVPCPLPCPLQLRWSFRQYLWGHNYVPARPDAKIFSVLPFWIFSFCYTLLFLLSFSISSYSSLLILSFSSYIFLFF